MQAAQRKIDPAVAARVLLDRRIERNSYAAFFKKAFGIIEPGSPLLWNWHIDLLAEYLEAVYHNEIKDLIINIPPRTLKSNIVTVGFPAWLLGKDPSEQIIRASYANKLAIRHNVSTRTIVESAYFRSVFPDTILSKDQNEKSMFQTTMRGHSIATSVGGTATGEGGNWLFLDDPMNPKEAISDTERESSNEWVDQTWSSRENNPKKAHNIIVMQRLNVNDTTGHVLAQDTGYEHLVVPQLAEKKTIIIFPRSKREVVREVKEPIHEERFGKKEISRAKKKLGSYGFAGQQQQRPVPLKGGRIKLHWFPRFQQLPRHWHETVLSFDTANKAKEINDHSVCEVYRRYGERWFLIDLWKERVVYPDLKKALYKLNGKYKPDTILIEDKASGQQLIQDARNESSLPIIAIEPEADKITRMDTQSASIESAVITLPAESLSTKYPWLYDLENNIKQFPQPAEWDEIDSMSQFLKWLRRHETDRPLETW